MTDELTQPSFYPAFECLVSYLFDYLMYMVYGSVTGGYPAVFKKVASLFILTFLGMKGTDRVQLFVAACHM